MLRSVTTHDAEFDDDDIDAWLEYQHEQSLICKGCGNPIDETMDDQIKSAWIAERLICWGCAARERAGQGPHGSKLLVKNRAKEG